MNRSCLTSLFTTLTPGSERSDDPDLSAITKRRLIPLLTILCLTSLAQAFADTPLAPPTAPSTQPAKPAPQFDLIVGKATYEIAPDQPFTILTPTGQRIEMVLRPKEILRFSDHGISFNYHRSMQLKTETEDDALLIYLETTDSLLAIITLYNTSESPVQLQQTLITGIQDEMKQRKGRPANPIGQRVTRLIAGQQSRGRKLEFTLAGETLYYEIHAFHTGNKTLSLLLYNTEEDATEASRLFNIISESLH